MKLSKEEQEFLDYINKTLGIKVKVIDDETPAKKGTKVEKPIQKEEPKNPVMPKKKIEDLTHKEFVNANWVVKPNNCYLAEIETPGIDKEDITLTFENGNIHILGTSSSHYSSSKYHVDIFITLPSEVKESDIDNISYITSNGITCIMVCVIKNRGIKITKLN